MSKDDQSAYSMPMKIEESITNHCLYMGNSSTLFDVTRNTIIAVHFVLRTRYYYSHLGDLEIVRIGFKILILKFLFLIRWKACF